MAETLLPGIHHRVVDGNGRTCHGSVRGHPRPLDNARDWAGWLNEMFEEGGPYTVERKIVGETEWERVG